MKFSELIQSLIAYTPVKQASGVLNAGTGDGYPAGGSAASPTNIGDGARLINEVRIAVRDELSGQQQRDPRGAKNTKLATRGTKPVLPSTPNVKSPSLNQGVQYGMGRGSGCGGSCGNDSGCGCGGGCGGCGGCGNDFAPDMSSYVKRENVYGL